MMNFDAYLDQCRAVIAEHGWMIQGVFATETSPGPPFAYTVGLTAAGLPELIITGLPHDLAPAILNNAAQSHLETELVPGKVCDTAASVPLRIAPAPNAEIGVAYQLYGERASALQLVWPDDAGIYPDEPDWNLPADAQPLLI
jgi:hypothetical protein